ncbi:hypothetical protein K2173_010541 [Erythroxylum novogranatense]|uniref:Uncharacterized protein n=1 Tax=Erythroxylum novogranatense TaxID=1862640 RepID=A0AAV8TFX0_9ROSI|nr:hypothetical protein K2173_010541 [Erythroxylum novogranatense]
MQSRNGSGDGTNEKIGEMRGFGVNGMFQKQKAEQSREEWERARAWLTAISICCRALKKVSPDCQRG